MALSRVRSYVRGKFLHTDLEASLNNIVTYINSFLVQNPLTSNLNFGSFDAVNFTSKQLAHIIIASEYTTLNDAIDALPSDGGVVYMPPHQGGGTGGAYEVTTSISLVANTTIIGGGWDSIVLVDSDIAGTLFECGNNIDNCNFLNFMIDGDFSVTNNVGAISLGSTDNTVVNHVKITDWGNDSEGVGDGIIIDGASRLWINDCHIKKCSRNGISSGTAGVGLATDVFITNNFLEENYHSGIAMEPFGSRTTLQGNQCVRNGGTQITCAIVNDDIDAVRIVDNTVIGDGVTNATVQRSGISMTQAGGATGKVENLQILNNMIKNVGDADQAGGFGIFVNLDTAAHKNIQVCDNQIYDTDRGGVDIQGQNGSMTNVLVANNQLFDTNRAGTAEGGATGFANDRAIQVAESTNFTITHAVVVDNQIHIASNGTQGPPSVYIGIGLTDGGGGLIDGNYINGPASNLGDILVSDPEVVMGTNFCSTAVYLL